MTQNANTAGELARYISERNCALLNLDMDWARKNMPAASSDEVRLIAMHKARYDCTGIEDSERHASRKWLQERGYKRIENMEFLQEGKLP
jgi:hypothetical protein